MRIARCAVFKFKWLYIIRQDKADETSLGPGMSNSGKGTCDGSYLSTVARGTSQIPCRKFQDVGNIIVDEISLVDARMLNAIDVMLRQVGKEKSHSVVSVSSSWEIFISFLRSTSCLCTRDLKTKTQRMTPATSISHAEPDVKRGSASTLPSSST